MFMFAEGLVLKQLLDWLRLRFCDGDHKAQEVVRSHLAEGHSDYWEAVSVYHSSLIL